IFRSPAGPSEGTLTMQQLAPLSAAQRLVIPLTLAVTALPAIAQAPTAEGSDFTQAEKRFNQICAGCHGQSGAGGDRAPALTNNTGLRTINESQIADLIKNGTRGGMPAFPLPERELRSLARWVRSLNIAAIDARPAGDAI